MSAEKTAAAAVGKMAMRLLEKNDLNPTPSNYKLAYHIASNVNTALSQQYAEYEDNQIRLTQKDADMFIARHLGDEGSKSGENTSAGQSSQSDDVVRRLMLQIGDVSAESAREAGDFGRQIANSADKLDTAAVAAIFAEMAKRASLAEERLNKASADAVDLQKKLEEAQSNAGRDALTGLPNRRSIDTHLETLATGSTGFHVAMVDIDHFKRINDNYGHAVGDRILKTVAKDIEDSAQPGFTGRWGGEEFLVIIEDSVHANALSIASKIRENISLRYFRLRENDKPVGMVTVSIGLAQAMPGRDIQQAIEAADKLLYIAKANGRNRIEHEGV